MASILRVNTLTDASSNNSTPMATVNQGTAKSWVDLNGGTADDSFNLGSDTDNGTGTVAIRDSFNIASITDNGTGDHTGTFTNAMNNDDFVCAGEGGTESGGTSHMFLCAHTKATGSARVTNLSDGGGAGDRNIHGWMLMGDLA